MTARPVRLVAAPETPTVDAHLGKITQPGHGWSHGVMVLTRRDVTLHDVHLVQVKVEDRLTAETEMLYFTDDGFEIHEVVGTPYGDNTRWGVTAYTDQAKARVKQLYRHSTMDGRFASNLARAVAIIKRLQSGRA